MTPRSSTALEDQASPQTIALRAFCPPPVPEPEASNGKKPKRTTAASPWTLVFDTETTADAAQQLRIGAYQLRHGDELIEAGLFYDPQSLNMGELKLARRICADRQFRLITVTEFIHEVFYSKAYDFRASIVGFNLPFDLSRIAIGHGSARGKIMHGGFSLKLSPNPRKPPIQVRHLNARASLIQFSHPPKRRDCRRDRKSKNMASERRGSFIDLKTIAAALTSQSHSLATLANLLQTPARKLEIDEYGARLTPESINYAFQDVEVTWQCFHVLRNRYNSHGLEATPMGKIISEAGLGKAYFKAMNIQPFREMQPEFPDRLIGIAMSAYFGGRSEVRWRRSVSRVLYCDFKSMYPTVCTLIGLWRYSIAKGVEFTDATARIKTFVETVTIEQFQDPKIWRQLTVLVRVLPNHDLFPIRAKYDGKSNTIGLNYLTSKPIWFTLADVIASKLLTRKCPEILEAIAFEPKEPQESLRAISIAGNSRYRIDPQADDFFRRLIDLRSATLEKFKRAAGAKRHQLDADQLALKIVANATSYGISAEMNVRDLADEYVSLNCFGHRGEPFEIETNKIEEPGRYFHPMLAAFITGAARLNLAIAEQLVIDRGLDWAFCDTDSMAIAKPDELKEAEFLARAKSICDWFEPLNPYEQKGPIFKIEEANFGIAELGQSEFEPLYCLCISAKRYALFNLGKSDEIIIRKASAHGLGHFRPPYDVGRAPGSIPTPVIKLIDIGVDRWQHDLWHQIVRAMLDSHPEEVALDYHSALNAPAASRYSATTPNLLRWFKPFNRNRPYRDQVRPFGFLIGFQAAPILELPKDDQISVGRNGRRRKLVVPKPIAPFDKDISKAAAHAFDRNTDQTVPAAQLITYVEALAQYHLSPESKFLNGDFADTGRTERRHIIASRIIHIGKESNRWEEQYYAGFDEDAEIEYGSAPDEFSIDDAVRELCGKVGQREAAIKLGLSRGTIIKIIERGSEGLTRKYRAHLARILHLEIGRCRRRI